MKWPLFAVFLFVISLPRLGAGIDENSGARRIFAHYMVALPAAGSRSTVEDYKREIVTAREFGIDGFALNCGGWTVEPFTPSYKARVLSIYQAAKEVSPDFKLFLSADFATRLSFAEFVDMVETFRGHPNQLHHARKPVISTFGGEAQKLTALASAEFVGERAISLVPFYYPTPAAEIPSDAQIRQVLNDNRGVAGFFYFGAAGTPGQLSDVVRRMAPAWRRAGKIFMAPVTPYYRGQKGNYRVFESHGFAGMAEQWEAAIDAQAEWVEIVTWNDWSECSYVAPFTRREDTVTMDGQVRNLLDHGAFLAASRYYIGWFKTGKKPVISKDEFFYFYRLHPKAAGPVPDRFPAGVERLEDKIYATVFLTTPATFGIRCGDSTQSHELPAGLHHVSAPLALGRPHFSLKRNARVVIEKTGEFEIGPENAWSDFNYFSSSSQPPRPGFR